MGMRSVEVLMKLRILDLFCKAGGAGMGYHQAGFEVVGVDIEPQKRYPFEFVQSDALEYLRGQAVDFDAIHASPPCQAYTRAKNMHNGKEYQKDHPDMIEEVRARLLETGLPFVIENVPDAPLINPVILCGTMFDELRVYRHRKFECHQFTFEPPRPCNHNHKMGKTKGEYHSLDKSEYITCVGHNFEAKSGRIAMGIDWMTRDEIAQAIPPAYTKHIGKALIKHLVGGGTCPNQVLG
jgi:DNA (cytosine-5)-methyltransferase 1